MPDPTTRDRLAASLLDAERVFTGRTQLDRAEHLADCLITDGWAPPADLPATLATVDDVRLVCEAAGLAEEPQHPPVQQRWRSAGDPAQVVVTVSEWLGSWWVDTDFGTVRFGRRWPSALLWHVIQAARSAS